MQLPTVNWLSASEKAVMLSSAQALFDDPEIRTSITLKGLTSTSLDWEVGTQTRVSTDDVVNALRRTVSAGEVTASGVTLQQGDRVYLIEQADISGELQAVDRIVDGSDVLSVVDWGSDPLGMFYMIAARGVGP